MATKTLELSADVLAVTNAERRLKRARERLAESLAMKRRLVEDHELEGTRSDPRDIEAHDDRVREDESLVARLESELDAARNAPLLRAAKEKRGTELLTQARKLDAEIAAAVDRLDAALSKAKPLADTIIREFGDPAYGYRTLVPPFARSTILSRLRFWQNDVNPARVKQYRAEGAKL